MNLTPNADELQFRRQIRDFIAAHREMAPDEGDSRLRTVERRRWQQLLLSNGYLGRTVPVQYGGFGAQLDLMEQRAISEEFAAAGITDRMLVANRQGVSMLIPTLLAFGSEEQKQKWIPPTLRGDLIWCQGYSEPGSGSDLASLSTRARVEGSEFVISGQKIWTSEAHQADMMFCLVRTEPSAPKHRGISFILVPMNAAGIEVRPLKTMTGRSSFNEVRLTDVRVPLDHLVGERGQGWEVANEALEHERGALGNPEVAQTRFQSLVDLMTRETVNGRRVIDDPIFTERLVKLQAWLLALRLNNSRILTCRMKGEDPGLCQLVVKLQGCELIHQISALAIDVLGVLGVLYDDSELVRAEGAWQRNYMFDLGLIIGGGTAQIQKTLIAERGLGMPRAAQT
jgi:alkylation response protein AidB-like acyl-CoA dehydrogenase